MNSNFYFHIILNISLFFLLNSNCLNAEELFHFKNVKYTDKWCSYVGKVEIEGLIADKDDEIGVFVDNGNEDEILIGACKVGDFISKSGYYFINLYGDDSTTYEKDGA